MKGKRKVVGFKDFAEFAENERNSLDAEQAYLRGEESFDDEEDSSDYDDYSNDDYDIESDSSFEFVDISETKKTKRKKHFNIKKAIIILASILGVFMIMTICIGCLKKSEVGLIEKAEVAEVAQVEVAQPEVVKPEVVQPEVVVEEAETQSDSSEIIKEEPIEIPVEKEIDYEEINTWYQSLEKPPLFTIWNTETGEKERVKANGEYELNDGEELLLYHDHWNVEEIEKIQFSPEGISSQASLQDKGSYYIIPICKSGSQSLEIDIKLSKGSVNACFDIINNKTQLDELVPDETTQEENIPIEEWLVQVANEVECASVVVWNEESGIREILGMEPYNLMEGDNFAIVAPYEIGSCTYSFNKFATCDEADIVDGIAYLEEMPETDWFGAKVYPADGIDLGPDALNNCENVMVYF